jgi:hypothetical protein
MDPRILGSCPSPLPFLLALPRGAVVGAPPAAWGDAHLADSPLASFGPVLRTEADLRHAVHRTPSRLILDARGLATSRVEAAVPALRTAMAVVVICTSDLGLLTRWCERLLWPDTTGFGWFTTEALRAGRCVELRLAGMSPERDRWVRISLRDGEGAESVLAAVRAGGMRVRESRIAYPLRAPR